MTARNLQNASLSILTKNYEATKEENLGSRSSEVPKDLTVL